MNKAVAKVNIFLLVASLDTRIDELYSLLEGLNREKVLILSTHHLLKLEREKLLSVHNDIIFAEFADFISEDEMVHCDIGADKEILNRYGTRYNKLGEYYSTIKKLKNSIILKNLENQYSFSQGLILNNSLGIAADVWIKAGLTPNHKENEVIIDKPNINSISKLRQKLNTLQRLFTVSQTQISICLNKATGENYLLLGRHSRLSQYFSADTVIIELFGFHKFIFKSLINNITTSCLVLPFIWTTLLKLYRKILISLIPAKLKMQPIIVPIHEYKEVYDKFASLFSADLYGVQDGYLPGNYSSCYLKYNTGLCHYLTWDNVSGEIFNLHDIAFKKTSILAKKVIKPIPLAPVKIKNVLILCSGAGDWTALKNRSDEDYMFEVFIESAKKLPEVNFVYRPHPLWIYPEHQGLYSIKRLGDYCKKLKLANFFISQNVSKEGYNGYAERNLSKRFNSIETEIAEADLIFGDHSQTMINAAAEGKLFASVNSTTRRNFFENINQFGFKCCKNCDDIVEYIQGLQHDISFLKEYNSAVEKYNRAK